MSRRLPKTSTKIFTDIYDTDAKFLADYSACRFPQTISVDNATILYYLLYSKYGNSCIANYDVNQFKYKLFGIVWEYGPTWQKRLDVQKILREMNLADITDDGSITDVLAHLGSSSTTLSGNDSNTRSVTESGTNTGNVTVAHTGTVSEIGSSNTTLEHDATVTTDNETTDITNHALNPGTTPAVNAYDPLGYIDDQTANKNVLDGEQVTDETTTTSGSSSNSTTYNNTDTTTNNLANSSTASITDSGTSSNTGTSQDSANDTNTQTLTAGKLKGYEKLLQLLETDVTVEFLDKFRVCFKQFALPGYGYYYYNDEEDED